MQRRLTFFVTLGCAIGGFFVFPFVSRAAEIWDVETTVQQDGATQVKIQVQDAAAITHWDFLDAKVDMATVAIFDAQGQQVAYTFSKVRPRIQLTFDEQTDFTLEYTSPNTVRDYDTHFEWVFELVHEPLDRQILIKTVTANFPENTEESSVPNAFVVSPSSAAPTTIRAEQITSSQFLLTDIEVPAHHELMVVSRLPESMIILREDGFFVKYGYIFLGLFLISPFALLFVLFLRWYHLGRDPQVEEDIDDKKVTPGMIGVIKDEVVGHKDLCAELIGLAERGAISFTKTRGKWVMKKGRSRALQPSQKILLETIFGKNKQCALTKDVSLRPVMMALYEQTEEQGYFSMNPRSVRRVYGFIGATLIALGYFGILFVYGYPLFFLGLVMLIFAMFMPQKTRKGLTVYHLAKRKKREVEDSTDWDDLSTAWLFSYEDDLIMRAKGKPPAYIHGRPSKKDLQELFQEVHLFCRRGIHIA